MKCKRSEINSQDNAVIPVVSKPNIHPGIEGVCRNDALRRVTYRLDEFPVIVPAVKWLTFSECRFSLLCSVVTFRASCIGSTDEIGLFGAVLELDVLEFGLVVSDELVVSLENVCSIGVGGTVLVDMAKCKLKKEY